MWLSRTLLHSFISELADASGTSGRQPFGPRPAVNAQPPTVDALIDGRSTALRSVLDLFDDKLRFVALWRFLWPLQTRGVSHSRGGGGGLCRGPTMFQRMAGE